MRPEESPVRFPGVRVSGAREGRRWYGRCTSNSAKDKKSHDQMVATKITTVSSAKTSRTK